MIIHPGSVVDALSRADVCIVGGGAAGITLAVELATTPLQVILIEEGGEAPDPAARAVYRAVPGPEITLGVEEDRKFYLGGNTNHWYGNCRPLDDVDFERRPWVAHSGWPIQREELLPFYNRAQAMSGLGSLAWYDVEACRPFLGPGVGPLDSSVLATRIEQTPPEFSFSVLHHEVLANAPNVTVLLGLHAVELKHDGSGRIATIEAALPDGSTVSVAADRFVIAAGGIENARLLLASDDLMRTLTPDTRDSVGRYFQEHLYFTFDVGLSRSRLLGPLRGLHLYDVGEGRDLTELQHFRQLVGDAQIWAQLVLSDDYSQQHETPGLSMWLARSWAGPTALGQLKTALRTPRTLPRAVIEVLRHPVVNADILWRKLTRRPGPQSLVVQLEQVPDPDNRVRLSTTNDRFGRPTARLDVAYDRQLAAAARSLEVAADELGLNGRLLAKEMKQKYRAGSFDFFWHHMGTTRMGEDPRSSVVDQNCRVHGLDNLFIAGSSVFPTSGTAGPTLTVVALAIRLADHIRTTSGVSSV